MRRVLILIVLCSASFAACSGSSDDAAPETCSLSGDLEARQDQLLDLVPRRSDQGVAPVQNALVEGKTIRAAVGMGSGQELDSIWVREEASCVIVSGVVSPANGGPAGHGDTGSVELDVPLGGRSLESMLGPVTLVTEEDWRGTPPG